MFFTALQNVLITVFYAAPGFIVRRMGKISEEHISSLSAVLIYICTPFLEISAFMRLEYSPRLLGEMGLYFIISLLLQALFILFMFFVLGRVHHGLTTRERLLGLASALGNVGFFGIPIMLSVFSGYPEAACFSSVNMLTLNILGFTVGIFGITGKREFLSLRQALINPNMLGIVIALPIYIFGIADIMPQPLVGAINSIAAMATPICMMILGVRVASMKLGRLLTQPKIYLFALIKLLGFPMFCFCLLYFLPLSTIVKSTAVILAGMPCAAILQNFAEMYDGDAELAANLITVSTLLSVLTIPLLTFPVSLF